MYKDVFKVLQIFYRVSFGTMGKVNGTGPLSPYKINIKHCEKGYQILGFYFRQTRSVKKISRLQNYRVDAKTTRASFICPSFIGLQK